MDTVQFEIPKTFLCAIGFVIVALLALLTFVALAMKSELPVWRFLFGMIGFQGSFMGAIYLFCQAYLPRSENNE